MTNQIRHDYMTIFNSSDVGIGLYEVLCKKICMSLLHNHSKENSKKKLLHFQA